MMNIQNIKDLFALESLTPVEIICYLQDAGLLTKSLICLKCNTDMRMKPFERSCDKFAWRCKKCRATKSVRSGSWFSRSHLPLQTILQITFMWCERKPSWLVRRELNIAQNTVIDWYNFCREICVEMMLKHKEKIGGIEKIVFFHDCKFEKFKYYREKSIKGNFVFGGIEEGSDRCFLRVVYDKSRETMISLFEKNIEPGTKIMWNFCKARECLGDSGLEYLNINYLITFKDPEESNSDEEFASCMKQCLPDFNCNRASFSSYLAEYMYRRLRENEDCLFPLFVKDIIQIYPVGNNATDNWRRESPKIGDALLTNSDPMWSPFVVNTKAKSSDV